MSVVRELALKEYLKQLDDKISSLRQFRELLAGLLGNEHVSPDQAARLNRLIYMGNEVYVVDADDKQQLSTALSLIIELAKLQEGVYSVVKDYLSKVPQGDLRLIVLEELELPARILLVTGRVGG